MEEYLDGMQRGFAARFFLTQPRWLSGAPMTQIKDKAERRIHTTCPDEFRGMVSLSECFFDTVPIAIGNTDKRQGRKKDSHRWGK